MSTYFITTPFLMELLAWDLVKGENCVFFVVGNKLQSSSNRLFIGCLEQVISKVHIKAAQA